MKIKSGDKVKVITGKYKGTESEVEKVMPNSGKIIVKNVNVVTKHAKASGRQKGGRIKVTKPIDASNVMLIDPKTKEPARAGYKIIDGKKIRISKKSGEALN